METKMEEVIYEGRTSLRSRMASLALGASLGVVGLASLTAQPGPGVAVALVCCLALLGGPCLRVRSSAFKVTTERVSRRMGWLARDSSELAIGAVRSVRVSQSALERFLGVGTVSFAMAGHAGLEITFAGIARPRAIAELVRSARTGAE